MTGRVWKSSGCFRSRLDALLVGDLAYGEKQLLRWGNQRTDVDGRSLVGAHSPVCLSPTHFADAPKLKAGDIPTTTFGKTGVQVSVIAQGGARMDLHPDVQTAARHVRRMYDLGITHFDGARSYWDGRSEEAYGIGLEGVSATNSIRP